MQVVGQCGRGCQISPRIVMYPKNKGHRNQVASQKKRNRLRKYDKDVLSHKWTNVLKSHATPCSCFMCSHLKYKRCKNKFTFNN